MSSFKAFIEDIYNEIFSLRSDPKSYSEKLKNEFEHYKGNNIRHRPGTVPLQTREGRYAVEEAFQELCEKEELPPLELSIGLCNAAIEHCIDTGKLGIVGHIGSKETSLQKRIEEYGKWSGNVIEALDYGSVSGAEVVLSLLIDDGLATRPHRKALLNPMFTKFGIGASPHSEFKTIACLLFAASYTDNDDLILLEPSEDPVPKNPEIHNWLEGAVKLTCEIREETQNGEKVRRIRKHWEMADRSIVTQDEIEKIDYEKKKPDHVVHHEHVEHSEHHEPHEHEGIITEKHEAPKESHNVPIESHSKDIEIKGKRSKGSSSDSSDEEKKKSKKSKDSSDNENKKSKKSKDSSDEEKGKSKKQKDSSDDEGNSSSSSH
ncbi:hypothetical protein SteCoe_27370 [Stentor coeruleus]|uniref:SCP domain-containing protein n=1 Tax=Stentor coeruleus TaxID=5963 RepID=A0A1R2BAR6_9CILI|nr:hypothetical protein SteCoe_27370 [Stentor coeruleus]